MLKINKNMKNNKGYIIAVICTQLTLAVVLGTCWCVNLYKLTQCDFEAPYKGEVIHAVGLIGPAAVVTVWFDDK